MLTFNNYASTLVIHLNIVPLTITNRSYKFKLCYIYCHDYILLVLTQYYFYSHEFIKLIAAMPEFQNYHVIVVRTIFFLSVE